MISFVVVVSCLRISFTVTLEEKKRDVVIFRLSSTLW